MKHTHTPILTVLIGALACAGSPLASAQTTTRSDSRPVVITPPAVPNGSNWSRAPFPAERKFNDVKGPDGQAIDELPPNTPATNLEPPVPEARVAILQPTTPGIGDPALLPTGRVATTTYYGAPARRVAQASTRSDSQPVVITPPAVPNGSNWSRAPFPAERKFDDVKAPDGQAIDELPPNTPATNIEPPVPEARVAILQPAPAPALADPALLPTGRVTVATSLDAASMTPTIRAATMSNREQVLADIETRLVASETALASVRNTASQLSTDARKQFNAANADVKEKARALRKSVQNARKAKDAEWESAKAQLAADFDAYAAALGRVDTAAAAR